MIDMHAHWRPAEAMDALVRSPWPGNVRQLRNIVQGAKAAASGARLIHEVPFEGAANKLVAFLHPKSTHGVLTEFCSEKPGAK